MSLSVVGTVGKGTHSISVDLNVQAGEVVGIVGNNGVGKSTLVETIAGIVPLLSGSLSMNEAIWDNASQKVWVSPEKRQCAVVFQDLRLFPHMSVMQNVTFGLRARGVKKESARSIALEFLEKLGAGHLADRKTAQLSGGEGQRVALARALAGNPEVLLLDEPLSAIDADSREQLRLVLGNVLKGFPGVALLVSHDPADVESLASRSIRLGP
jgi:molybdate transport system ATP-binding protein